jgi:hypothetical protein
MTSESIRLSVHHFDAIHNPGVAPVEELCDEAGSPFVGGADWNSCGYVFDYKNRRYRQMKPRVSFRTNAQRRPFDATPKRAV